MAVDKKHRDEQDLERYGVWVKAGPDELDGHDSTSLELMDIEDSDNEELLITEEEEQLLGELEDSALPDFGDFDDSFDADMDDAGFDDDDFQLPSDEEKMFGVPSDERDDVSSQGLLHKIEDDLNALRDEIRQLKDEITGLRVPSVSQDQTEALESAGFFDEEDDETIALTGDELDNILDSADMTEESAAQPEPAFETANEDISIEDEEMIDLSGDFEDIEDVESPEIDLETEESEADPALSILSSPDIPDDEGDEDTIEIDIPGSDDMIDLGDTDDEPVVSIDDISHDEEESGDFEEITDLEDFGLDSAESFDLSDIEEDQEEILPSPSEEISVTEDLENEAFDEGEEVEIDLSGVEDDLEHIEDSDLMDVEMEEISLDDFGLDDDMPSAPEPETAAAESTEEETDVLAVDDEEIDLTDIEAEDLEAAEGVEDIDLESVLAESIDEDIGLDDFEDIQLEEDIPRKGSPQEEDSDLVIEEIDLKADDIEEAVIDEIDLETDDFEDVAIEEIDLEADDSDEAEIEEIEDIELESPEEADGELEIEEIDLEDQDASDLDDLIVEEIDLSTSGEDEIEEIQAEEIEDLVEEVEIEDIEIDDQEEFPEISLDEAIDEIETPEEFSFDEQEESDEVETLELELEDEDGSELEVSLPEDDDFNVLPGTEEVDLDSLEALAAAPDMTEASTEDVVELPEIDVDDDFTAIDLEETTDPSTLSEKAKTALELGSLPGDLKEEIKDVLRYMDQLLESLPDDKIQEFARSEHFEVYKKIFEELGISD